MNHLKEGQTEELRIRCEEGFYEKIAEDYDHTNHSNRFAAQRFAREALQIDLQRVYGFEHGDGNPRYPVDRKKLDKLFEIAWENGHASGYFEVCQQYNELSELVR
jgi:hypothetical protein